MGFTHSSSRLYELVELPCQATPFEGVLSHAPFSPCKRIGKADFGPLITPRPWISHGQGVRSPSAGTRQARPRAHKPSPISMPLVVFRHVNQWFALRSPS